MSNLFTEQIKEREKLDRSMKEQAEGMIENSVKRNDFDDRFQIIRNNEEALNLIFSECGMTRDQLDNIDKEDLLFISVGDDPDWYRYQTGYCVAKDGKGNTIGLIPGAFRGYYYYDENRVKHKINQSNAGSFEEVYCLCRLLPEKTLSMSDLVYYLFSYMRHGAFLLYIVLAILAGLLGLVFPNIVTMLVSFGGKAGRDRGSIVVLIVVLCITMELLRLLINTLLNVYRAVFSNMIEYNIKNTILFHYLGTRDEQVSKRDAQEIWAAINNDIPEFINNIQGGIFAIIPSLIFSLCYCGATVYYLPKGSIWIFLILITLTIVIGIIYSGFDKWYARSLKNRIKGDRLLFQIFKGIEKIRSRYAERRIYLRWAGVYSVEAFCDKTRKRYGATADAVSDFLTPLVTVVLILIVLFNHISYSTYLTGVLLVGLLVPQVYTLAINFERLFNSRAMWNNISYLFDRGKKEEKKAICREFSGKVTVENVSFAYPGMERLIDDISFEVKEGEYVGITGLSGCGKSTLLKLILGILTPNKGEISYGRYDLAHTDQRSILKNMGIVLQNETLIPGTIRQNLMMQPRPVTEEKMWETLEKVGIADLVRSYPYGLDTEMGMTGAEMSGGQMQKMLIARAIISEPKMVVFDEATSALDNVSQREIKDVLDAMKCTRIVVAHRLSTVKDCDKIILLENGKISQQGTYEELVAKEGQFRELVLCQGAE